MRILVVDDEPDLRIALARALRIECYGRRAGRRRARRARRAGRRAPGRRALDGAHARRDGLEVCRRLRATGDPRPREIELRRTEFRLLELFLTHPPRCRRARGSSSTCGAFDPGPASNAPAVYVAGLRRKTEQEGEPRLSGAWATW